jgi:hypothetical protein
LPRKTTVVFGDKDIINTRETFWESSRDKREAMIFDPE